MTRSTAIWCGVSLTGRRPGVDSGRVGRGVAAIASALLSLTLAAWILLELSIRFRELAGRRGGTSRDRFTRVLVAGSLGASIALAEVGASHVHSLRMPGAFRAVGLIVLWAGLAIRAWAVIAPGRSFRTTVEVDPGQAVVSSGPYARIRHPSYTGLLLIAAGFGLALGNWLSFAICLVLPWPGLLRRVSVEEAEMERVLGDAYRSYQRRTKRLIPGVW